MLKTTDLKLSREEQYELGYAVQKGVRASEKLASDEVFSTEELRQMNEDIANGEIAQDILFEAHIGLANSLAKNMHSKAGVSYDLNDMAQDAYMGLTKAILTYDPSHDCLLSTHAYRRTTKELSISLNKMRSVRLPENKMAEYLQITRAENKYRQLHGEEGTSSDELKFIHEDTGLNYETIGLIKRSIRGAVSLNAPLGPDGGEIGDLVEGEGETPAVFDNPILIEIMEKLSEKEKNLIAFEYNYGENTMSLSKFIEVYGIPEESIPKEARKVTRAIRNSLKK